MKEKDLSTDSESGKNEKKSPGIKKLGDKIGPVNDRLSLGEQSDDSEMHPHRNKANKDSHGDR